VAVSGEAVRFGRHLASTPAGVGTSSWPGLWKLALAAFSLATDGILVLAHACDSGGAAVRCAGRALFGAAAARASAARCCDYLLVVCGRASWYVASRGLRFRRPCEHSTPTVITCMRRKVCSAGAALTRHGPLVGWWQRVLAAPPRPTGVRSPLLGHQAPPPWEHNTTNRQHALRHKVCSAGAALTRHGPLVGWWQRVLAAPPRPIGVRSPLRGEQQAGCRFHHS
jgi:hypothetical protein